MKISIPWSEVFCFSPLGKCVRKPVLGVVCGGPLSTDAVHEARVGVEDRLLHRLKWKNNCKLVSHKLKVFNLKSPTMTYQSTDTFASKIKISVSPGSKSTISPRILCSTRVNFLSLSGT
jgi:hypothetical protein